MAHPLERKVTRRTLAAGAAWSIPAIAFANAAPAYAASGDTATLVTPQFFQGRYTYDAGGACSTSNPTGGFIDTQGVTPTGGPYSGLTPDGDGKLSTTSSIGYWLETTAASGTATVRSITTVYTFSQPIVVDALAGTYASKGTWRWTEATTLNGWTYSLSADGKTLTLTYTGPYRLDTSTSVSGTGTYMPGYFINYHFATACPVTIPTISSSTTWTYETKDKPTGATWTKTTPVTNVY